MEPKFRIHELKALEKHPDALQAMADYNDQMAAEADAMGYTECVEFHEKRARAFEAESKQIRAEWDGSSARLKAFTKAKREYYKVLVPMPDKCSSCSRQTRLFLDHCSITNLPRGWICQSCNVGIGHLGDSVTGVFKALRYLIENST